MDHKAAIDQAIFDATVEICKKYNIAFYIGKIEKGAKKVG